jgi:tetratricopeptide (TPR) repeat protein
MKRRNQLALLLSFVTVVTVSNAFAKVERSRSYKDELSNRRPGMTSRSVNKKLERAQIMMSKGAYDKAISILTNLTNSRRNPFETAKTWQTLAYANAQSEKYAGARKAFKKVLEIDALPYKPTMQSIFALAQLQMMDGKHDLALKTIDDWFFLSNQENPAAYVFKASILNEKGDKFKDEALKLVLKAIKISKKPKENWLVFAVSLLYTKEKYQEAGEILYKLVELKPKKKAYWSQLAGSLLNRDQYKHALAVLELAMMMELLTEEGEIKNIVSLYNQNNMPYEAAKFLRFAFGKKLLKRDAKNLELLANSLVSAKEYDAAMKPLNEAAGLSKDGALFAMQGRLWLEKEDFNKAIGSFNKAMKKGLKKKQEGQILIEMAIAHIQIGKFQSAQNYLSKANKFKDQKKAVQSWQAYLSSVQ